MSKIPTITSSNELSSQALRKIVKTSLKKTKF